MQAVSNGKFFVPFSHIPNEVFKFKLSSNSIQTKDNDDCNLGSCEIPS